MILSLESRVWSASILNAIALGMQLWAVVSAHSVEGVSRGMLLIFLFMQFTFAEVGWKKKMWGQFWGMAMSFVITLAILCLTFFY